MAEHMCSERENISKLLEELHLQKTKNAVLESKVETIEGEQTDMKTDIKTLNNDLNKGNTRILVSVIASSLLIIVGLLANIFIK